RHPRRVNGRRMVLSCGQRRDIGPAALVRRKRCRSCAASSSAIPESVSSSSPPLSREGKCMSRCLPVLCVVLLWAGSVQGSGFLLPGASPPPPLAMVSHHVEVSLVEQVSTTKVTQVFRNHTDRALEATYLFPVPKGASVNRFAMWVDGKEVKGELV